MRILIEKYAVEKAILLFNDEDIEVLRGYIEIARKGDEQDRLQASYNLVRLMPNYIQFLKLSDSPDVNIEESKTFDRYVDFFAVSHNTQDKGVGSMLLKERVFPYIAKNGGGMVSLVTNTGINRKFYMSNGFEEFQEENFTLKNESVKNWSYRMHIDNALD